MLSKWLLWFLLGLVVALVLSSCGHVARAGGYGTVKIDGCEIILDGTLGTMPPTRGGPVCPYEDGTGLMCEVYTW